MAGNTRKCLYCKASININTEDYIKVGSKYSHKKCYEDKRIETDMYNKLTDYIKFLYLPYEPDWKMIGSQLKRYKDEGMTYYGMRYTLEYFYRIKKNKIDYEKGVGIIPYHYKQAISYYKRIKDLEDKANYIMKDKNNKVEQKEEVIIISNPIVEKKLMDFDY